MTKRDPKPKPLSDTDVLSHVQQIMADPQFGDRNTEYQARRDYLYGRTAVAVPGLIDLKTEYRHPKLRKDANRYKDRLLAAGPDVSVAAQADGPRAIEKAQTMKNFGARLLKKWRAQGLFDGPVFDMVAVGRGNVHLALNREVMPLWPGEGEYAGDPEAFLKQHEDVIKEFAAGERSDLFVPEHVMPETVYWTADRSIKLMAARVPLRPLISEYSKPGTAEEAQLTSLMDAIATDSGGGTATREATIYIVEDKDFIYHVLYAHTDYNSKRGTYGVDDGQMVGCYLNVFGTPAFFDLDGERTGDPHALYSALPIVDGMYQTGPLISIFGTIIASGGIEQAQQQQTLEPLPGAEAQAARDAAGGNMQMRLLDNKFVLAPDGWGIRPSGIALGEDTVNAMTMLLAQEMEYGYPRVLSQPQEIHATSGYDRAKAQDAVTDVMSTPLEHIGDLDNALIMACFHAVKALAMPVTVRDLSPSVRVGERGVQVSQCITLDPEDVIDVDSSVSFDSVTQYAKIAQQEEWMKMRSEGLVHDDEFLGDARGIEDIERWHDEKAVSAMRAEADAEAHKDASELFQRIKQTVRADAVRKANLKPPMDEIAQTVLGEEQGADELTASMPTGPGSAMSIQPAPSPEAELGAMV